MCLTHFELFARGRFPRVHISLGARVHSVKINIIVIIITVQLTVINTSADTDQWRDERVRANHRSQHWFSAVINCRKSVR